MPNTYLDVRANYPDHVSPSRDYHALAANDIQYRQEPFQIQGRRLPVSFKAPIARPVTMKQQMPSLPLQRIAISVRSSNQRPIEAGIGPQSQNWRVSDPAAFGDQLAGADPSGALPGMGALPSTTAGLLGIGALLGLAAYYLGHKRGAH